MTAPFNLLSRLWLREPGPQALDRAAAELDLPRGDPAALAADFSDVLLLNVYPYGTVFTDEAAELNGPGAQRARARYAAHGYAPAELNEVAAADHLGLGLGLLAHLEQRGAALDDSLSDLMLWAPLCCLAVERLPTAPPFYRGLAEHTREALFAAAAHLEPPPEPPDNLPPPPDPLSEEDELSLRDLVRFFLAPARCGVFFSRGRLGHMAARLGARLPFSSRFEVAELLLASADTPALLVELEAEVDLWAAAYRQWAGDCLAWGPMAASWLERGAAARGVLAGMRQALASA